MARKPRFDLVTPALIAAIAALLGVWWWSLGGRPPDLAMAPAQSTLPPPKRPKPAPPREPPPVEEVARDAPRPLDGQTDRLADAIVSMAESTENPVLCRLLYPEPLAAFAMVWRHGEYAGVAILGGDRLLFMLTEAPTAGPLFLEITDRTDVMVGGPPGRTASVELVGDPLRCDPDPVVLPDPTNVAEVVLVVRNPGEPGQTTATGCGGNGQADASGRIHLAVYADHLDEGCTISITRRDGVLDVPGAEIELGPEDADGEITVDLPEARTGGLGTSLELQGDAVVLLEIFPGTPAAAAGLQPGDRIVSADGQALPADIEGARSLLTGPEGSEVELEVESDDGVRIVRITRAVLQ